MSDRRLFLAVFLVAVALATPLASHNENRTLDLLRALGRGRLSIDADQANTVDKAFVPKKASAAIALGDAAPVAALPEVQGHYYSGGAPGLAFALFPVHEVARRVLPASPPGDRWLELVLVIAGGALPLALSAVAVRRALAALGASQEAAFLGASLTAFGTIALPFATRLFCHSLVLALLAWSLALLLESKGQGRRAVLAGFLAAFAVTADYLSGVPALALLGLAFLQGGARGALAFASGGALPAVLLASYHQACFGSPVKTCYSFHADAGIRSNYAQGAFGFTAPPPRVILELLLGTRRGILFTEPLVLLGLYGLVAESRRSKTHALALATWAALFLVNAARVFDWDAGQSFGPRYQTPTLAFVALGIPRGLERAGRGGRVLAFASVALALVAAVTRWGNDVWTSLDELFAYGPSLRGVPYLIFDAPPGEVSVRTAVASALALALVAPLLVRQLKNCVPLTRYEMVVSWIVPFVLTIPVLTTLARHGDRGLEQARAGILEREMHRMLAAAREAREARLLAAIAAREAGQGSPLHQEALARLAELEAREQKR